MKISGIQSMHIFNSSYEMITITAMLVLIHTHPTHTPSPFQPPLIQPISHPKPLAISSCISFQLHKGSSIFLAHPVPIITDSPKSQCHKSVLLRPSAKMDGCCCRQNATVTRTELCVFSGQRLVWQAKLLTVLPQDQWSFGGVTFPLCIITIHICFQMNVNQYIAIHEMRDRTAMRK